MTAMEPKSAITPLSAKLELAKAVQAKKELRPGMYFDALDTANTWCVAEVLEIRGTDVYFRYDGWAAKYNALYSASTRKIQPFRLYSHAYTGHKNLIHSREPFALERLAEEHGKVKGILETDFGCLESAESVTQYLRGRLFTYLDQLFSYEFALPETEIAPVLQFFTSSLRLIILWLKWLSKHFSAYVEWRTHPELFLVDREVALAACTGEMLYLLGLFFCLSQHSLRFFLRYDTNVPESIQQSRFLNPKLTASHGDFTAKHKTVFSPDYLNETIASQELLVFGLLATFFHSFCHEEGIEAILSLVMPGKLPKDCDLDIATAASLIYTLSGAAGVMSEETAKVVVEAAEKAVLGRVKGIDPKEIKDVSIQDIDTSIECTRRALRLGYEAEKVGLILDEYHLLLALKMVQCPYLDRRLKGLAEIKRRIDEITPKDAAVNPYGGLKSDSSQTQNIERMLDWVKRNAVLQLIFNDNAHAEMIKRGTAILLFVAKYDTNLDWGILDLIWNCQLNKYEDIIRAIYSTLESIVDQISSANIEYLFSKIRAIPIDKYDEKLIAFMRCFTLKALGTHTEEGHQTMMEDAPSKSDSPDPHSEVAVPVSGLFCVPIFWEIMQDNVPFGLELTELALKALLETLKPEYYSSKFSLAYMGLCMQNVKQGKSVCQSLVLAKELIAQYNGKNGPLIRVPHEAIQKLHEQFKLVDTLIESLVRYRKVSDSRAGVETKDMLVEGKYTHEQNLEARFSFLEYVLENNVDFKLELPHLITLWDEFVTHCRCFTSKKFFLRWLLFSRNKQSVSSLSRMFADKAVTKLFDLISGSAGELSTEVAATFYKCFEKYFVLSNLQLGFMEDGKANDGHQRVKDLEHLYGMDELWDMAGGNRHEKARLSFCRLLTNLYLFPSESVLPQRLSIWQAFLKKAMERLARADLEDRETNVENIVKLLLTFFSRLDGDAYLAGSSTQNTAPQKEILKVTFEGQTHQVSVPTYYTVGQLRKRLGEQFGIAFADCGLVLTFRTLYHEDDDKLIKEVGLPGVVVQSVNVSRVEPRVTPTNHPKYLLAQNQDYINLIFRLLSKEHLLHANICWELLTSLPRNAKIEQDISKIDLPAPDTASWDRLLDSGSIHKLLYSLQIVEDILKEAEPMLTNEADPATAIKTVERVYLKDQWSADFLSKQGSNHLFHCLLTIPMHSISQPLARKCFALLMKVIIQLFKNSPKSYSEQSTIYVKEKDEIIARIMGFLEAASRPSPVRKQTRGSIRRESQCEDELVADLFDKEELDNKTRAEEVEAVGNGFRLMKSTYSGRYNYFERMAEYKGFAEVIKNGLQFSDSPLLRKQFAAEIVGMCGEYQKFSQFTLAPHKVVLTMMLRDMITDTTSCESQCVEFFNTLKQTVDRIPKSLLLQLPINHQSTIQAIVLMLMKHISTETQASTVDDMLTGMLNLLSALLKKFPQFKQAVGQDPVSGLLREILHNCLFDHPISGKRYRNPNPTINPPKCKSKESRSAAFSLLCTLSRDTPANIDATISYLVPLHKNGRWKLGNSPAWEVSSAGAEKSATGFVGLKNLGCICYMNSLLQQLYMIPSLRRAILEAREISTGEVKSPMLHQLQRLFAELDESVKQFYNPEPFCKEFTDIEGNPIDAFEQMDVDEFFNMLTDKLETALKETTKAATIKEHFGGVFSNQIICKDCPHQSEREEPFSAINLQIKNKKSLHECLKSFVEGEVMEGNNAYHCDRCDKKVAAVKRVCIKSLPNHLIFVLKRFSYNYDIGQKVKLNDYCEFPMAINMEPYTAECLAKKASADQQQEMKDGSTTEVSPTRTGNATYEYRLVGVIIHRGTADGGHYYSLIMDRERNLGAEKERWFEFNDKNVDKFPYEDIAKEAFGGEESSEEYGRRRKFERFDNAYMLFYEKKELMSGATKDEAERGKEEIGMNKSIRDAIIRENIRYWQAKLLMNEDYFTFLTLFSLAWNSAEANQDSTLRPRAIKLSPEEQLPLALDEKSFHDLQLRVFKYVSTVALTTLARARNREHLYSFVDILKLYLRKHYTLARWFLNVFTNPGVCEEFLLTDSSPTVKATIEGLLNTAMQKVFETERANMEDPGRSSLANFINFISSCLHHAKVHGLDSPRYYKLFLDIAMLGYEARKYLNSIEAMRRLNNFLGEELPTSPEPKYKTALLVHTNPEDELGLGISESGPPPMENRDKAIPDYSFLVECMATLWSASAPIKPGMGESSLGLKPYVPFDRAVITDALCKKHVIVDWIWMCKQKSALNSLSIALAHIAWESKTVKGYLRATFIMGLEGVTCEYNNVRSFLRPVFIMSMHPDSTTEDFLKDFLRDFSVTLAKFQYAYYFTLYALEGLLNLCHRSKLLAKALSQSFAVYEWILEYYKNSPYPPRPAAGWTVRLYKNEESNSEVLSHPTNHYLNQQEITNWMCRTDKVVADMERIKSGSDLSDQPKPGIDFEEDLSCQPFIPGMSVEYKLGNEWTAATVDKCTGELLKLSYASYGKKYYAWIEATSDLIAREGTNLTRPADGSSTLKENSSSERD